MNVNTLPMAAGWTWLREGLALYRRQAFAFTALVIIYSMALMLFASVPVIGLPMAALLVPFGTIGLTAAGREAERNVMPMPSLLLAGWRSASPIRSALLKLGGIHALMVVALAVVTSLVARDELSRWTFVDGQLDPGSAAANVPWDAIFLAAALYLPILMMTWFAPQLIAWHQQPVGKALFFSFFACWRNRGPLLLLGVLLAAMTVALSWIASQVLAMLGLSPQLAQLLFAPFALVLTSIAYSTQYPIYRAVLAPEPAPEETPAPR